MDKYLSDIMGRLSKISPTLCVAKWKQVTIHLHSGYSHSCHHCLAHKIPSNALKYNPAILHNTPRLLLSRKMMYEGYRPPECQYCWRIEDSDSSIISDRIIKSASNWAVEYIDEIEDRGWHYNVLPSYVEVSFSNVCNCSCIYCGPSVSSRWENEISRYGSYPTSREYNSLKHQRKNVAKSDNNKANSLFHTAWWQWLPAIYPDLRVFRITGGEPLLSEDTYRCIEWIIMHPNRNLCFAINSSLSIPTFFKHKFLSCLNRLEEAVGEITIFSSADAFGRQAEYIRYGMEFNRWLDSIYELLTVYPRLKISIMCTYNVLSLPSFGSLLAAMGKIKEETGDRYGGQSARIWVDIPYLRYPAHLSVNISTPDLWRYLEDQIILMESNPVFTYLEIHKLKIIRNLLYSQPKDNKYLQNLKIARTDFARFICEYDRRRGTNFSRTFPELEYFLNYCRNL